MTTTVTEQDFRDALRCLPSGVTVVTTGPKPVGATITSFCSVSLKPPLVLFCLYKHMSTYKAFENNPYFAAHLLREDQEDLSVLFSHGSKVDFSKLSYHLSGDQMPLLPDVDVILECAKTACYEAGDHSVFIGEVKRIQNSLIEKPLIRFRRQYTTIKQDTMKLKSSL